MVENKHYFWNKPLPRNPRLNKYDCNMKNYLPLTTIYKQFSK